MAGLRRDSSMRAGAQMSLLEDGRQGFTRLIDVEDLPIVMRRVSQVTP
jgi:hypothetical protein